MSYIVWIVDTPGAPVVQRKVPPTGGVRSGAPTKPSTKHGATINVNNGQTFGSQRACCSLVLVRVSARLSDVLWPTRPRHSRG